MSNSEPTITILDSRGVPMRAQDTAYFAASREARELKSWTPRLESADAELFGEAGAMASRAYDLERNNGIATGVIRTISDNVVGTGIRLCARPDYVAMGKDKAWADKWSRITEAKFRTFANNTSFDAAEHHTFGGMTVMQLRVALLSGDATAIPLWMPGRPGVKWATCVQSVDPARLTNPISTILPFTSSIGGNQILPNGNVVRNGIEIAPTGAPVAYWVRKTHPGDVFAFGMTQAFTWERIPAKTDFGRRRFLHLFEKLRPGQSRGRSILAGVMGAFKMLDHYQRTELQTVVAHSMIAGFIETPLEGEDIAALYGSPEKFIESRNEWEVKMQGSSIIPLHPGDKMNAFLPTRPNSAYSAFVEAVLRYIGTGLNLPYELLMKDFSKTNYSSARAALLEAWRYFLSMRDWLSTYWATPIYELWLEEAINIGEIEAPDFYENRAAYCACVWIGPGRGWIDPLKEAQASDTRLKSGISTLENEANEQGDDWEQIMQQRARESDYAEELGIPDPHAPPPQGGAPGQQAAPAKPGAPDDPQADETGAQTNARERAEA